MQSQLCTISKRQFSAVVKVITGGCVSYGVLDVTEGTEHVQFLIDELPPELTTVQRTQAAKFIQTDVSKFSKSDTDLGRNDMLSHRINTRNNPAVKQPLRRHPDAHLDEIERNVKEMLKAGVIKLAASP
jgi:hypothetical protein